MKKLFFICFIVSTFFALHTHCSTLISTRLADTHDLAEILILDRRVTYEFFKPLYIKHYSHLVIGKDPDYFLELELKSDEQIFAHVIKEKCLYVACDKHNNHIVGFLSFHEENIFLHLDLLLVDENYRRVGVGRKLVTHMFEDHKGTEACVVYPLRFANEKALAFYESLGFVNKGVPQGAMINYYGIPYADMHWYYLRTS